MIGSILVDFGRACRDSVGFGWGIGFRGGREDT